MAALELSAPEARSKFSQIVSQIVLFLQLLLVLREAPRSFNFYGGISTISYFYICKS